MMKRLSILLLAAATVLLTLAQQVPQFTSSNYEGWTYNNPNITLTPTNISGGKIALYVGSQGYVLTLISPQFACQGIDTIAASVVWYTPGFNTSGFVLDRTALTLAIDDENGQPVDSVTVTPTAMASTHTLQFTLPVPRQLTNARLRFVSWDGTVESSGSIKRALITAVESTPHDEPLPGDVDNNGVVNISDVTLLISYVLSESGDINTDAADLDGNGSINISDVTTLISHVLNS